MYKETMDQGLMAVGVFLAGAASGALLKYLQDRRLLASYRDLVKNLSQALQEQVGILRRANGARQGKLLVMEKARAKTGLN